MRFWKTKEEKKRDLQSVDKRTKRIEQYYNLLGQLELDGLLKPEQTDQARKQIRENLKSFRKTKRELNDMKIGIAWSSPKETPKKEKK